jgi:hypothetical protein
MPCHHALAEPLRAYINAARVAEEPQGWLFRNPAALARIGSADHSAKDAHIGALIHIFCHEPSAAANYAGRALRIREEQHIAEQHAFALLAVARGAKRPSGFKKALG